MTAKLSLALSIALVAAPAFADGHGSHGGGGGASASSHGGGSGGGQHPGGGGPYHAVPRTGSPSHGGYARHPGGGTGRYYYHGHYYYGHGHGYYPYYGGYYYPYFYGYYGYYPYYYGGYYPYYDGGGQGGSSDYDGPYYDPGPGAVRLIVDPESTKVYVDGYYSGIVDDYDGMFQHLDLPMGKHELLLKLDGYQTQKLKVFVTPGQTLKVHYSMIKGSGEAANEIVVGDPAMDKYPPRLRDESSDREHVTTNHRDDDDNDDDAPPPPQAHVQARPMRHEEGATLRLSVTPADASVYVDGSFYGTARDVHRLDMAPGPHKVEVVRPGYRTYERDVDLVADKSTDLDVTLDR